MRTIRVEGEGFKPYDVLVGEGLLARAAELAGPLIDGRRVAVVADETVSALHGPALRGALDRGGVASSLITIPAGEASKSFAELERLTDRLLALDLDRKDVLIALGGGVVGDLTGFAAAIYKRGVDFIQIPTTLLAQVDSSVGGKTAIDTPRGKNLVGAFWQPRLVVCDLGVLDTLPMRERRAGFAEVLKYGLLGDAGFFDVLEADAAAVIAGEREQLGHAVARSIEMKAQIVGEDAREAGRRALLNLGHTFAHAFEAETGFGEALLHGEAVALGCALAFRFSAGQGLCPLGHAERVAAAIAAAGLPERIEKLGRGFSAARLVAHMAQDKKAEGGALVFILARAIGQAFVARGVDSSAVTRFLVEEGCDP